MSPKHITARCNLCKACPELCPTQSIFFGDRQYVIDSDTCHDCGICVTVCPVEAILPLTPTSQDQNNKKQTSAPTK